jgi:broad specificity phosphatase PhoE
VLSSPRCRCLDTARLAFGQAQPWEVLQGSLNDAERRRRQLAEIRDAVAAHRTGPPLVLVTHGSVVSDLTGLTIQMRATGTPHSPRRRAAPECARPASA